MFFRKKPVVIEARQYTGNNGTDLRLWSGGKITESPVCEPSENNPTGAYVQIQTLEGVLIGIVNDWLICGVKGEFYPCKPDIFEATYEKVESAPVQQTTNQSAPLNPFHHKSSGVIQMGQSGGGVL